MLKIWILTEDSGQESEDVLKNLVKRMLRIVDSACQTHAPLVQFVYPDLQPKLTIRANEWKSAKYKDRVRLIQTIADFLVDEVFVFFHVDADRVWSQVYNTEGQADVAQCENWQAFNDRIMIPVSDFIENRKSPNFPTRQSVEWHVQERFFKVIPFYSIESWLYQNIDHALTLCHKHHQGRDVERFNAWSQDRTQLDEVFQPKDNICLQAKYNLELAENAYPARAVYEARRSFHWCVCQMEQSWALLEALDRTRRG